MTVRIYGIRNCDTMKKAFDWLKAQGVPYDFHDYRADGVDSAAVKSWCDKLGWANVLNKASTTFKNLPDADKVGLDEDKAIALMVREPTMIKRPVLEVGDQVLNGFKPEVYRAAMEKRAN